MSGRTGLKTTGKDCFNEEAEESSATLLPSGGGAKTSERHFSACISASLN